MMRIEVTEDFLDHRSEKADMYNRRGRDEERFLMDLDCEILEYTMIHAEIWEEHEDWRVDAITEKNLNIDVKFIDKWYNISNQKMLNILQQRNILDGYDFWQWEERPDCPLREGDQVFIRHLGYVEFNTLADNIRVSRGKWGGFYADIRGLLGCS